MNKIVSHKQNKYSNYISSLDNTSNVIVLETGDVNFDLKVKEDEYSLIFSGLGEHKMPIVFLCNPEKGSTKKPHRLYLKKQGLLHLCLTIRDDVSVRNFNYERIIDYTISRIVNLLVMSEREEEREYRKEFLYFWNKASSNQHKAQLYIESAKEFKNLYIYTSKKKKSIIVDKSIALNDIFKNGFLQEKVNVLYLPISNTDGILPPLEDEKWEVDDLKYVLNKCISESNIENIEQQIIIGKVVYFVFEMKLPEILPITFMLRVEFSNKKSGNIFKRLLDVINLEHCSSQRCDLEYLFKRIGVSSVPSSKKVLVVGAGSLGGYILSELPKLGVDDITIFDYDDYSLENILRHRLDILFADTNKAFAMAFSILSNYPQLAVSYHNERFSEEKLQAYNLESYDLIIIATGGTDYMLSLNKQFNSMQLNTTVIYSWIEPNGNAVHALVVDYSKKGCFKCLYSNGVSNKAHFQNVIGKRQLTGTGCGGVFNPYGNLTLLKGTAMIVELIQMYFNNKDTFSFNPLYSVKTFSYQNYPYKILNRRNCDDDKGFYIDEGCDICGDRVRL